jgi:hypothetical protein
VVPHFLDKDSFQGHFPKNLDAAVD